MSDVKLPGIEDPLRASVRAWLEENPEPTGRMLAEAGLVAPHWPAPYGLGADAVHQLIIDEELRRARVKRPKNQVGIEWAGPTILAAGTLEQQERYLPRILSGEDFWCQLFSEPEAGSDLANLRTLAVRDGDHYVVSGRKIWTTLASDAQFGILLARTNPDAPKHRGITYFICQMHDPGISATPIREMTGIEMFYEVTLENVRIPVENVVGEIDDGWRLARVTLENERVQLSAGRLLFGRGPTARELIAHAATNGSELHGSIRERIARAHHVGEVLRFMRADTLRAQLAGSSSGPEASVSKLLGATHAQDVLDVAKEVMGDLAATDGDGPLGSTKQDLWDYGWLLSPALTIGGGTREIQLNIIAERALGFPRDDDPLIDSPWNARRRIK